MNSDQSNKSQTQEAHKGAKTQLTDNKGKPRRKVKRKPCKTAKRLRIESVKALSGETSKGVICGMWFINKKDKRQDMNTLARNYLLTPACTDQDRRYFLSASNTSRFCRVVIAMAALFTGKWSTSVVCKEDIRLITGMNMNIVFTLMQRSGWFEQLHALWPRHYILSPKGVALASLLIAAMERHFSNVVVYRIESAKDREELDILLKR